MNHAWRRRGSAERYGVPVEMRFVDMFMAALGALVFMAMLLAFLLRFLPTERLPPKPLLPDEGKPGPLQLLTNALPAARVGEPYELALAYRGGKGPVVWEVVAGEKEDLAGLRLDTDQGLISGTPTATKTVQFVLRIRDRENAADERPYTLAIEPPRQGSRSAERWLAGIMLTGAVLAWLVSLGAKHQLSQVLTALRTAWDNGQSGAQIQTGVGVTEVIELPEGIEEYQRRLAGIKGFSRFFFVLIIVFTAWLIWRLWLGS